MNEQIKDEGLTCAYLLGKSDGYKQGGADAIDDAIHRLDNSKAICHEDYVDGIDFAIGVLRNIAEQMQKEVENERYKGKSN